METNRFEHIEAFEEYNEISVDPEGIHGVAGDPMCSLTASYDYQLSTENAAKEINAVCRALFESGADRVYVWDNHGGGNNINFENVDPRAIHYIPSLNIQSRLDFAAELTLAGQIFLGYHAREGTRFGVLAHTYDSVSNQYFKLNGKAIGEYEMDSSFAGVHGVPSIFAAADLRGSQACPVQTACRQAALLPFRAGAVFMMHQKRASRIFCSLSSLCTGEKIFHPDC